jgi:hypothetical protein
LEFQNCEDAMKRRAVALRFTAAVFALVLAGALFLPVAQAQGPAAGMNCRQIWDDAANEAARAALERANRDAGAAPAGAGASWANPWTQAWKSAWTSAGILLKPGLNGDCCHINWFELGVMTGKTASENAWKAAPQLNGAAETWSAKFAAAYVDEWAKVWFLYYPWLCARAKANAAADASASASAQAHAGAYAWALAFARAGAFATTSADSFTFAWTNTWASAWASTGAMALASAQASASASAKAGVSGDCAFARASACADAAAEAFAMAWADAGASAFAEAYAYAWADAYAYAFANAWASAQASAGGAAYARAASRAFAKAIADAYADVWRVKLADRGQLPQIVAWWTKPGAPRPNVRKIWSLLARDEMEARRSAFAKARRDAIASKTAWSIAFDQAADEAVSEATSEAESWATSWASQWASSWAEDWMETYILICARAAAAVCKTCPCTTQTPGTTTTGERPRTITKPTGFTYTLIGLGVNSGTVFIIQFTNETGETITVEVPGGTVFVPSNPGVQRVLIAQTSETQVPPNQSAQSPLTGYCLDYGKQPPPATSRGALQTEGVLVASLGPDAILSSLPQGSSVKYSVDDNPAAYAPILRIIESGNELASQGKFHRDMPPDRYKLAVIQRAIWTYTSRGTATPHTRETLLADIRKQVKESGGTQSESDINDLVNHLTEDINAVLKAAGVQ